LLDANASNFRNRALSEMKKFCLYPRASDVHSIAHLPVMHRPNAWQGSLGNAGKQNFSGSIVSSSAGALPSQRSTKPAACVFLACWLSSDLELAHPGYCRIRERVEPILRLASFFFKALFKEN
jgi:hypothetical protein